MRRNQEEISEGGIIVFLFVLLNAIILEQGFVADPKWYKVAYISIPLLLFSVIMFSRKSL